MAGGLWRVHDRYVHVIHDRVDLIQGTVVEHFPNIRRVECCVALCNVVSEGWTPYSEAFLTILSITG